MKHMMNILNYDPHCCHYSLFPVSFYPLLCAVVDLPHCFLLLYYIYIFMVSSHLSILIISCLMYICFFSPASYPLILPFFISAHACVSSLLSLSWPCLFLLSNRLRLARMNEEMREAEAPLGQPGQYHSSSPTEQQYRKCIQEFICLTIEEC